MFIKGIAARVVAALDRKRGARRPRNGLGQDDPATFARTSGYTKKQNALAVLDGATRNSLEEAAG